MPTVEARGFQFEYSAAGDGEPLIFVHGSLNDLRSWAAQLEPFAQRFHVISYSRRYHHPNPWVGSGTDYSAALHAADLASIIERLGLGRVHLVGSSFGAFTCLAYAAAHPDAVRTLVLGEPPILPWLDWSQEGQELHRAFVADTWEPAGQALQAGELERGVRTFIDGVIGKGTFDRLPEMVRSAMLENAAELKAETMSPDYFSPHLTCTDVRRISAPTLLLTGDRSPVMFHRITDELERCLPNHERAVIPNASHGMHSNNPSAYNEIVLAFLDRHRQPG